MDFFLKLLAETPVTQHSFCYSAVSASLMNPLPDCSNHSPFCHTHYLILWIYTSSLVWGLDPYQAAPLETNTSLLQRFTAESNQDSGVMQCLEAEASIDHPPPLQIVISVPFFLFSLISLSLSSLSSLSQYSRFSISPSLSTIPSLACGTSALPSPCSWIASSPKKVLTVL